MKRLFIFLAIGVFLFNWIGYQLYTEFAETDASQNLSSPSSEHKLPASSLHASKTTIFHLSLYEKEMDFDDLLEFTSTPDYSVSEIFFTLSDDLFPDHANKENQRAGFKCFNGEYYSAQSKLLAKYPDTVHSGIEPDRYLLNIPSVFLSPQEHPPQVLS